MSTASSWTSKTAAKCMLHRGLETPKNTLTRNTGKFLVNCSAKASANFCEVHMPRSTATNPFKLSTTSQTNPVNAHVYDTRVVELSRESCQGCAIVSRVLCGRVGVGLGSGPATLLPTRGASKVYVFFMFHPFSDNVNIARCESAAPGSMNRIIHD